MEYVESKSIFTPATGFIQRGGFAWTCNPYIGCTYGCTYCYAAYLPQNRRPVQEWGQWLTAKRNAVECAKIQAKKMARQAIYMSSVTDPYLPVERSLQLSRGIVEALLPYQPRLVVQTRGALVIRDVDLIRRLQSKRVNISISTDSEAIRQQFEPKAPPLEDRWQAAHQLRAAGVPIGICITPTLPIQNPIAFRDRLLRFQPDVLVIQEFHDSKGRFGANTGVVALELVDQFRWGPQDYRAFRDELQSHMKVFEGEAGFFPPPA